MIQLIADESRLLGTVPAIPEWKPFQWPKSGMVTTTKEKFTVKD
jgi:hypothetical protein